MLYFFEMLFHREWQNTKGCDEMNTKVGVQTELETEWQDMPLYMGYADIKKLGFKKTQIYQWFHSADFPPMLRKDAKKVNKYKLKQWLEEREEKADEVW